MGVGDINRTSPPGTPHFLLSETTPSPAPKPSEATTSAESAELSSSLGIQAHVKDIIKDDVDEELPLIAGILSKVHEQFFSQLLDSVPDTKPPDVKEILDSRKRATLSGVHLTFSGIIPTGMPPERFELWRLATIFGASCASTIQPGTTTHLVTFRTDTDKVLQAIEAGNIAIVKPDWLLRCFREWKRVSETGYHLANLDLISRPKPKGLDPDDLLAMNRELAELENSSDEELGEDWTNQETTDSNGEQDEPDPKRRHLAKAEAGTPSGTNPTFEDDSDDDSFVKNLEQELL